MKLPTAMYLNIIRKYGDTYYELYRRNREEVGSKSIFWIRTHPHDMLKQTHQQTDILRLRVALDQKHPTLLTYCTNLHTYTYLHTVKKAPRPSGAAWRARPSWGCWTRGGKSWRKGQPLWARGGSSRVLLHGVLDGGDATRERSMDSVRVYAYSKWLTFPSLVCAFCLTDRIKCAYVHSNVTQCTHLPPDALTPHSAWGLEPVYLRARSPTKWSQQDRGGAGPGVMPERLSSN